MRYSEILGWAVEHLENYYQNLAGMFLHNSVQYSIYLLQFKARTRDNPARVVAFTAAPRGVTPPMTDRHSNLRFRYSSRDRRTDSRSLGGHYEAEQSRVEWSPLFSSLFSSLSPELILRLIRFRYCFERAGGRDLKLRSQST